MSSSALLLLTHLVGLSLAVGAATLKVLLLLKCYADHTFLPVYSRVSKTVTGQIITGMILLTLSGIGWLLTGYTFTPLLITKLILFGAVWVIGPIIDNVVEPKFHKLAPAPGQAPSPAFIRARTQFLGFEIVATLLFYVTMVIWVRG